jgi:hypothetical protein
LRRGAGSASFARIVDIAFTECGVDPEKSTI